MNNKKILLFTTDSVGGAERVTVIIGKYLMNRGYDVLFCIVKGKSISSSICSFIPKDARIDIIDYCNPVLMTIRLVSRVIKYRPDFVFASCMYLNSKILPFRFITPNTSYVIRSENYLAMFNARQKLQMSLSYRLADKIIAQNQEMKDEMVNKLRISPPKIKVLLNPIDTSLINEKLKDEKSPYEDSKRPIFVASGRFAQQKGYDIMVRAFAEVLKSIPTAHLYILGDNFGGNEVYQEVMLISNKLNILNHLHCVGFKNNPYPWIKYADCFVLSSRMEGLPNVLIEALYMGVPSVSTICIPIISKIVQDGENGFLANVDDIKSLSDAMIKALSLKNVKSLYTSASAEDFVNLFE